MISNFEKFRLLLWKNWILQWRHKLALFLEIFLPASLFMLLTMPRMAIEPSSHDAVIFDRALPIDTLSLFKRLNKRTPLDYSLIYSPNTSDVVTKIVEQAAKSLNLKFEGCAYAQILQDTMTDSIYFAGVEFSDSLAGKTTYPDKLSYKLRFPSELRTVVKFSFLFNWETNNMFPLFSKDKGGGPINPNDDDGGTPPGYLREGFLPVQNAIATAFISQAATRKDKIPDISLQRYPYAAYIQDDFLSNIGDPINFIIMLSFLYPVSMTVKNITAEKEKQLKEVMKIMGLQNWLHWAAWFVKAFVVMGFLILLINVILMKKGKNGLAILTHSSFTAVFFFLLIYTVASITLCFMLATFFSKANTAAVFTGLIWILTFSPYVSLNEQLDLLSLDSKLGWCLISNVAISFGFRIIFSFELDGVGLQWSNMFSPVSVDDPLSLGHIIGMMCVASVVQMVICLYIEQVFPGEFGVPKKWYFPFTKTFWCGDREYIEIEDDHVNVVRANSDSFEAEPMGKNVGLQVKNLCKQFGRRKAVKGLSLNMYEGEITVLLGHNGAGKTTTISMLTGMFPPTSGTAIINGSDIRTNIDSARMSLGICPQHNILFDDMTVKDHLIFYSSLKGLKDKELDAEVVRYIQKTNFTSKANVPSSRLSGGMKRKLSVCAAFCGGAKVVLCDEPSSGMDPAARRKLWDFLQSEKAGRTVLLTTHFMDEADVLGDRIAIMSSGELKCMGTPFFLKKRFGNGYRLTLVKKEKCDSSKVTALLAKYIPGIQPKTEIGTELSYQLPDRYSPHFEKMLYDLETSSDNLDVNGFGISITSLEEVFAQVGSEEMNLPEPWVTTVTNSRRFRSDDGESLSSDSVFSASTGRLKGLKLVLSQWRSMIWKKFLYTIRNKKLLAIQNLLPFVLTVATFMGSALMAYRPLDPLTASLSQYHSTVTVLDKSTVVDGTLEGEISRNYERVVKSHSGDHTFAVTGSKNFIDYMLELGRTLQNQINKKYIAAATVSEGKITAWLNNEPLHSALLTVNLVHNALAKTFINQDASIEVTNAPLSFTRESKTAMLDIGQNIGTQIASELSFSMNILTAMYIFFQIKEYQSRAKLLQYVCGVGIFTFWLSHIVWDMLTYTITVLIVIITLAWFQVGGYSTFEELTRYFILLELFGCSAILFTYLIAKRYSEPAHAFVKLVFLNFVFGTIFFVTILFIRFLMERQFENMVLRYLLLYPHFALVHGMNELYSNYATNNLCEDAPKLYGECIIPMCCNLQPYFGWEAPGVLRHVTYLICTSVAFFILLIILEYRLIDNILFAIRKTTLRQPPPHSDGYYDEDVAYEMNRIRNMTFEDILAQNLVVDRLSKYYGNFLAVNQISVCVKHSECFGLLGVNGAGKTTTFKMLTGDERIDFGEAYVNGLRLKSDMRLVYREIGYCPQFDALFDEFTGRETLKIYALLQGIPESEISEISSYLARSFGFYQHYDKEVHAYSGGNKRKLSTALAFLGSPSVIYLDEPTTGMDPGARRQLWNMVCKIRDVGSTIVLTSHSMEECEALCTRSAIMVNGEFKCMGSTQHLKNKFNKGFILKIRLMKNTRMSRSSALFKAADNISANELPYLMEKDVEKVLDFIKQKFPEAYLRERFQAILTFHIPLSTVQWSKIFGLIESNKDALNIEDYSISQTTLEEIFQEFAKNQYISSSD